ncbi:MAG: hypothetical protein HHAS10_06950 [Candidatus Altimarinota bacterium]
MRISLGIIAVTLSLTLGVSALEYPFIDVPLGSNSYPSVKSLFDNGILFDDASHKFKPDEPLTRDVFAGLTLGSSCNFCLNPTVDVIAQYQTSPFPDVTPESPYYYCISQAIKNSIISVYPPGQNGSITCENNETYSSAAYCKNNKVTRIEAVKSLLLESKLWSDELNKKPAKNITISDIADSDYGYAEKAVQVGILSLSNDGKVFPNVAITRGEFASMSAKIFDFNQCIPPQKQNKSGSSIKISDNNGTAYKESTVGSNTILTVEGITPERDTMTFSWKAIDGITKKELNFNGSSFKTDALGVGVWFIKLTVLNKENSEKMSVNSITLTISDGTQVSAGKNLGPNISGNAINNILYPSLIIDSTSSTLGAGGTFSFITYGNSSGSLRYAWDFGDGARVLTSSGKIDHTYTVPGTYVANVIATDSLGRSAGGSITIVVTGSLDSDNDSIPDSSDICPLVKGSSSDGCPKIETNLYTAGAFLIGNNSQNNSASYNSMNNADGNSNNAFSNSMPQLGLSSTDTDNDGVDDSLDACPTNPGNPSNGGCPLVGSFLGNIEKNGCLMDQIGQHGGIIIEPICESCPCPTSVSLGNNIRRCDMVFPAILSKDLSEIYSRGPLYQIP